MLQYFYTGKYVQLDNEKEDLQQALLSQVLTYGLADKYDVPTLLGLMKEKFESQLSLTDSPKAKEYLTVVPHIYAMPVSTKLRASIVEFTRSQIRGFDIEMFRDTFLEVPEFAFDVFQLFINKNKLPSLRGHCPTCSSTQSARLLEARCKCYNIVRLTGNCWHCGTNYGRMLEACCKRCGNGGVIIEESFV